METKYLNHITLNTGHCRKSYPSEVNEDLYFRIKRLFERSLENEIEIFDGYTMKSTGTPIGYLISLFGEHGGDKVPILTVGCSNNDNGILWELLHSTASLPLVTEPNDKIPLPYIASRLEIGAETFLDDLQWTGDFSRCMGWICLAPEKVRK